MRKYEPIFDDVELENIKNKSKSKRKSKVNDIEETKKEKRSPYIYIVLLITLVSVISLLVVTIMKSSDLVNQMEEIYKVILLLVFTLFFVLSSLKNDKKGNIFAALASIMLIGYSVFNISIYMDLIKIPEQASIKDFTNSNLSEVVKWTKSNKIKLEQVYEYSDLVDEYNVISQDQKEGTLVKNIDTLMVVVSSGPNYDKELIMPSFVGKNVDSVIEFVDENFLTGVNIDFIESTDERDTVISQDKSGEIRRSDVINMTASIGSLDDIGDMKMKELIGLDTFHATTWLKRYGFKYVVEYEYSDTVKKGVVIKQSVNKDKLVNPLTEEIIITISKGPKIIVPDLTSMSVEEITAWVIENHLKVSFEENYDDTVEIGKVISVNVEKDEEIEQGTLIVVTVSLGQIKMQDFKSSAEFREWAEKYGINYKEEYEFSDSVPSGNIIKTSHNVSDIIKNNDTVVITVSQGKSISVPNFVGKSKSEITKLCSSSNLKCSFNYGGFSESVAKDVATSQNKKAGSNVASGTSVVIILSSGKAQSYNVFIQSSWFANGNADATIASLKSKLEAACPGVTFKFVKKTVNTGVGIITKDSPVKAGNNTFKQGNTYTIYVGA